MIYLSILEWVEVIESVRHMGIAHIIMQRESVSVRRVRQKLWRRSLM